MTLWFATGNTHKQEELAAILNENTVCCTLKIPADGGFTFDPNEDGASFAENSLIKARALWKIVGEPVIADDSGLCVDALGGRPGIFSARYGAKQGEKLDASRRNELLLTELGAISRRSARFVCAMTLLFDENRFVITQETLEGEIVHAAQGEGGFGYDPLLYLPELGRTVAELPAAEKNKLSHRARAARALLPHLYHGAY
ncbi:MAG: RdgB/HAM1 family non-canonical purine NTP pyrophosphatase [Spirochaetaceae bacterium]|jgi:XTP/dITP diphosphohydrolase|nr:RdgB/HAM1 family non-canonical purine NTP pyrophosphatase [Spirochaetaceae bacterium]